jgi:hypothetical protein
MTRKRVSVALMFRVQGVRPFNLKEVCDACKTNSRVVAKVESKIGDLKLRKALKDFFEERRDGSLASERERRPLEFRIGLSV